MSAAHELHRPPCESTLVCGSRASRARCCWWNYWLATVLLLAGMRQASAEESVPVEPELKWYKGNLHARSLWSDGNDFPEMIADWYRSHGYHFLTLSDHDVLSQGERWMPLVEIDKRRGRSIYDYRNQGWAELPEGDPRKRPSLEKYIARFGADWVETRGDRDAGTLEVRLKPLDEFRPLLEERGQFLLIQGEEVSDSVQKLALHLNVSNLRDVILPVGGPTLREALEGNLRAAQEQSKKTGRELLIHLNHPNYDWAVTAEDLAAVPLARFFEVYNGHPGVRLQGDQDHASTDEMWDIANTLRIAESQAPLYGLATDDSHHFHGEGYSWPGRGWIMVRARQLTPESLIRAINEGDFYASTGVVLGDVCYSPESQTLELSIEPDGDATFTTRFLGTPSDLDPTSEVRKDQQGKPLATTRRYSRDVGTTFSSVDGLRPAYRLMGKELYVRAVVTSNRPASSPSYAGALKQAWTQPVGWQPRVNPARAASAP